MNQSNESNENRTIFINQSSNQSIALAFVARPSRGFIFGRCALWSNSPSISKKERAPHRVFRISPHPKIISVGNKNNATL